MKIYVAGPMTEKTKVRRTEEHHKYPAFHEAARRLRAAGHIVYNPATNVAGDLVDPYYDAKTPEQWASFSPEEYQAEYRAVMARDIRWILEVDALALLPGWRDSQGAMFEHSVACMLGKKIDNVASYLPGGKEFELEHSQAAHDAAIPTIDEMRKIGQQNPTVSEPTLKWAGDEAIPMQSPQYAGDVGYDLVVSLRSVIRPGRSEDVMTSTTAVEIPEGYWGLIVGRSSTLRKRGVLVNTGIIDNGYRGPLFVNVHNPSDANVVALERGERVAQLILLPLHTPALKHTIEPAMSRTERGNRSFGSTGR